MHSEWKTPSVWPELAGDAVHIWRARLDQPEEVRDRLYGTLNEEERAQALRLRAERDRERFICAEGFLRAVLASYMDVAAKDVVYRRNAHGKPELDGGAPSWLKFNLSHSHNWALVALARDREIGVDIELIDDKRPIRRLIERFFAPEEVAAFDTVEDKDLPSLFYAGWTRKEAYVKARGVGLRFGMRRFAVSVGDAAPILRSVEGEPEEPGRWSIFDLTPGDGFRAAVVVEGASPTVHTRQWLA